MNIMLIIVLLFVVFKIAQGYKKGMVKEIISFVSLIILCVVVVLIGAGLHSYMDKQILGVVVAVLLLAVVGIAHHLLSVVFFSAKLISKLPIINWVDKLCGMVVGALEVVIFLWTLYTFILYFELGTIGNMIVEYTAQSKILTTIYEFNLLAPIIADVVTKVS